MGDQRPAPFFEPLSAADAWFLYAERPETPLDIGTVYIFEGGSRIAGRSGAAEIEKRIAQRIHLLPRYRMKIHPVRFHLGHPVWVDDAGFDLGYHVRHEVLPPPADGRVFRATVARILQRPLDMRRPLWDITVVHGLADGRIALVNRAHHAMIDGVSSADIATLLLDPTPEGFEAVPAAPWTPRPAPSSWALMVPLLRNRWRRRMKATRRDFKRSWAFWRFPYGGLLAVLRNTLRPSRDLFFNRRLGLQRTGRGLKVPLDTFKRLKASHGCTVNDAVLALVAEALHRWFAERGQPSPEQVRVFCPVSVRAQDEHGAGGNQVSGIVLELPTGEMAFEDRLKHVNVTTGDLKRTRQAVAAQRLAGLAGWAPATLLVLSGRLMPNAQGGANINVTNVPGPQLPLYCEGAELLEVWPFAPLYPNMGLGVAVVSYNGSVYFGISADADVVPDVEIFARHLREAAAACADLATAPAG